jgi:hypothetical protein
MATSISGQIKQIATNVSDGLTLVTRRLGIESLSTTYAKPQERPSFNYVTQKSPEETSGKSTEGPKILSFPSDIENVNYFITFRFTSKNYLEDFFNRQDITDINSTIRLPMPNTLIDSFNVGYSSQSLGTLLGYGLSTGIPNDVFNILTKREEGTVDQIISNATSKASSIKSEFFKNNSDTLVAAAKYAMKTINSELGYASDYITGTALNPYQALFFEGPELRNHNFSFKLSPNSAQESRILRDIINTFKTRMLPERTGFLYKYPDSCLIELSTRQGQGLYTMYRSVLKSVNINYAPNNVPVFFKNGYDPVEVNLDLSFAEVLPVTRTEVEKSIQQSK